MPHSLRVRPGCLILMRGKSRRFAPGEESLLFLVQAWILQSAQKNRKTGRYSKVREGTPYRVVYLNVPFLSLGTRRYAKVLVPKRT